MEPPLAVEPPPPEVIMDPPLAVEPPPPRTLEEAPASAELAALPGLLRSEEALPPMAEPIPPMSAETRGEAAIARRRALENCMIGFFFDLIDNYRKESNS